MIFSKETGEIYYLLNLLLGRYSISILIKIMDYKKNAELKETINWYIKNGIDVNRLSIKNSNIYVKTIFIPKNIRDRPGDIMILFPHITILLEYFRYNGIILNLDSDRNYSLPTTSEKISTLNDYIKNFGMLDIYDKLFNYKLDNITDIIGNQCIRSIIRIDTSDRIQYEYKTIAIKDKKFIDPIDRVSTLI